MTNSVQKFDPNAQSLNPFGSSAPARAGGVAGSAEMTRAQAEIQGAIVLAKRFPRNQKEAAERILEACKRPSLAEQATYAYPRGGSTVTGPSIRLAEAIAQNWGNLDFGIRELERKNGASEMQAYCWDLETNVRVTKNFTVEHKRKSGKSVYDLTDPRDIYEMTANQGSRRLRACVLGVIPGDVVEAAVEQCNRTLTGGTGPDGEKVEAMLAAFAGLGVPQHAIEGYVGGDLSEMSSNQFTQLKGAYRAIKDNVASKEDFFGEHLQTKPGESKPANTDDLNSMVGKTAPKPKAEKAEPTEETEPEPADGPADHSHYGSWKSARRSLGQLLSGLKVEREDVEAGIAAAHQVDGIEQVEPTEFEAAVSGIREADDREAAVKALLGDDADEPELLV